MNGVSFFECFSNEILEYIFYNTIKCYKTKEEAKLNVTKYIIDKFTRNFILHINEIYINLPSLIEYQKSNIYIKDNFDDYIICKNITHCLCNHFDSNIVKYETFILSSQDKEKDFINKIGQDALSEEFIKLIENLDDFPCDLICDYNDYGDYIIYNESKIIWNCEYFPIQLPLYYEFIKLYQQKLFYKKGGNWTMKDIYKKVIEFYQEKTAEIEAKQLINYITTEFNRLPNSFFDIKTEYTKENYFQHKLELSKDEVEHLFTIEYLITKSKYFLLSIEGLESGETFRYLWINGITYIPVIKNNKIIPMFEFIICPNHNSE